MPWKSVLPLVMERLAPDSEMTEETDSLGISALSLEGAMRSALRGEGWGGMEMLILPCVGTFEVDMQLGTGLVIHKVCRCLWGLGVA